MNEKELVGLVVDNLEQRGFRVITEVANFYRSADIAALDEDNRIWIIECKISDISRGLNQLEVHKQSADKVFLATPFRETRTSTLKKIEASGVGLIYLMPDGDIDIAIVNKTEPWPPARERFFNRIKGFLYG